MNTAFARTWFFIVFGWFCLFVTISIFRPLMPVDETRYMTVAWEMLMRDTWLLPTLNYEPYSHKPPMLFWLIRSGWEMFGVGDAPVRGILSLFVLSFFYLTSQFARLLLPQEKTLPAMIMLLLAAMPVFLIYASMIMFDTLLTVFVMLALFCIWNAAHDNRIKPFLWLGAALGLGILTKGPVALVYILPVALLAPFWAGTLPVTRKIWYYHLGLSLLIGAAMALCWALPAAIEGGHAYAEKIFVTQSAGRMVQAFDHERPIWFYIPALIGFLLPCLLIPAFWQNLRTKAYTLWVDDATRKPIRFLVCVITPAFLFFSVISSKQFHYLMPLLPSFLILVGLMFCRANKPVSTLWPVLLTALPTLTIFGIYVFETLTHKEIDQIKHIMDGFMPMLALVHVLSVCALAWVCARKPAMSFLNLAGASFLVVVVLHIQLGQAFFPRYDLSQARAAFAPYSNRPLAILPKYDGEYGYEMRLTKHAFVDDLGWLDTWLKQHPNGIVIVRDNYNKDITRYYNILYAYGFRFDKRVAILEMKR